MHIVLHNAACPAMLQLDHQAEHSGEDDKHAAVQQWWQHACTCRSTSKQCVKAAAHGAGDDDHDGSDGWDMVQRPPGMQRPHVSAASFMDASTASLAPSSAASKPLEKQPSEPLLSYLLA